MASELHDVLAQRISEHSSNPAEQGAILISTAHRLGMACAVFNSLDCEFIDAIDVQVEDAMISAGWDVINVSNPS